MITLSELREMIKNGEDSMIEFKQDTVDSTSLAREMVAFSNFEGGYIILGVDDNGSVVGLTRPNLEEWVMNISRDMIHPGIIPLYRMFCDVESGKDVAVVRVIRGLNVRTLYRKHKHDYYIRVGSQSREPSPDELSRLFQQRGLTGAEKHPINGAEFDNLDIRRLRDYFHRVRGQEVPEADNAYDWERVLVNTGLMVEDGITLAALLLFSRNPGQFAYHAGIFAVAFSGEEKDYDYRDRETICGAMVPLMDSSNVVLETGLVERAVEFVRRNTGVSATLVDGARREEKPAYPVKVVREAIVNALIHRDYYMANSKIELHLYSNRLEIISPGRLPNGVTTEQILAGVRTVRNQTICSTMSQYRYVDVMGMGVSRIIAKGMMEHNGTQPKLVTDHQRLKLVLYK